MGNLEFTLFWASEEGIAYMRNNFLGQFYFKPPVDNDRKFREMVSNDMHPMMLQGLKLNPFCELNKSLNSIPDADDYVDAIKNFYSYFQFIFYSRDPALEVCRDKTLDFVNVLANSIKKDYFEILSNNEIAQRYLFLLEYTPSQVVDYLDNGKNNFFKSESVFVSKPISELILSKCL